MPHFVHPSDSLSLRGTNVMDKPTDNTHSTDRPRYGKCVRIGEIVFFVAATAVVMATTMTSSVVKYGCFNTMLEMGCVNKHVLVFDSARYGRNNTAVSVHRLLQGAPIEKIP